MKKEINVISDCRGMFEEEIIETIMESRGIEDVEHFLNPTEDDLLPLGKLKNIDSAADIIIKGIEDGENFFILADVDVDGATAGTVMGRYLSNFTDKISMRINEGKVHGLQKELVNEIENGILIIVDSLNGDTKLYKKLADKGVKIVIADHHEVKPRVQYSKYVTLVTSAKDYENPELTGVGVTWKLANAIDDKMGTSYSYDLLDLVATGLIADMGSMKSMENRYLVNEGFKEIKNPFLKKVAGGFKYNSKTVSFSVAPIINASNRMNANHNALNAFMSDNNKEVLAEKKVLESCKVKQNEIIDEIMQPLIEQAKDQEDKKMVVVYMESGKNLSGLIANRISVEVQKPVLAVQKRDGQISGSMRSVGVGDFRTMLNDTGLCQVDGHPEAAGFVCDENNIEELQSIIEDKLSDIEFKRTISVDAEIEVDDITRSFVDRVMEIDKISGKDFKPLKFKVTLDRACIIDKWVDKHLVFGSHNYVQFIKWNGVDLRDEIEDKIMLGEPITVICSLENGFMGREFSNRAIIDEILD